MRFPSLRFAAAFLLLGAVVCSNAHAFDKKKPASALAQAPELTDADKKKIAEIEQRPEIKAEIESEWDAKRLADMDFLYQVNSSSRLGNASGPEYATFIQHYGQLYNNPMLQRYLNAMGQRLVPKDSPNTYAFKLVLNPVPTAEAYSTGTILVSTGLVSMLDNEAQLAYVLGHEVAHVEKMHRYQIVRMSVLEPALNAEKQADAAKKKAIFTAVTAVAGAGLGAAIGGSSGAIGGLALGVGGGLIASQLLIHDRTTHTEWADIYEDEADETSLKYMLDQSYDVREAPRLYARLETAASRDPRIGLGFIAKSARMKARNAHISTLLSGDLKDSINAKLKTAGLTGSSGEFALIMASLKRDNGIVAIDYDLFAMARDNLEEAVSLRTNDSRAQLYLGKVISLTARNADERQEAEKHFLKAIQYDESRGAYPEPHLEHALHLIGENGDKDEIRKEVEAYVALYQREHAGSLPGNMHVLYDYLTLVGETNWYAAPASVVSTKYVEAVRTSGGSSTGLNGTEVVAAATSSDPASKVLVSTPDAPEKKRPVAKKVVAPK
jgi:tetratricopeptide (TPR) repeat protein